MPGVERNRSEIEQLHKNVIEATHGYDIKALQRQVVDSVERNAVVRNLETGYVLVEDANQLLDTRLLIAAAVVVRDGFVNQIPEAKRPTRVIGIPNRGKELALLTGLVCNLRVPVTDRQKSSKKNFQSYYDKQQKRVYIGPIGSFTKGVDYVYEIVHLSPEDDPNVLVIDDFSATGGVTRGFYQGLIDLGFNPYSAVLVEKKFPDLEKPQIGYQKLREEGAPVFAVSVLTSIRSDGVTAIPGEFYNFN